MSDDTVTDHPITVPLDAFLGYRCRMCRTAFSVPLLGPNQTATCPSCGLVCDQGLPVQVRSFVDGQVQVLTERPPKSSCLSCYGRGYVGIAINHDRPTERDVRLCKCLGQCFHPPGVC